MAMYIYKKAKRSEFLRRAQSNIHFKTNPSADITAPKNKFGCSQPTYMLKPEWKSGLTPSTGAYIAQWATGYQKYSKNLKFA